jgi:hypothetical protein
LHLWYLNAAPIVEKRINPFHYIPERMQHWHRF